MAFNIGVNVIEVDGSAAPAIAAAPVSVAGFLVRSQRGVPNQAVPIRSLANFFNHFGGFVPGVYGAHAMRGFYDNGGTQAYAVRVLGSGNAAATTILNDRNVVSAATLQLAVGKRGQPDPGAWGDGITVIVADHPRGTSAIPAQLIGTAAEPFSLSPGDTLEITVNGGSAPVTITFSDTDFTDIDDAAASDVAAAVNEQTTAVRASVTSDQRLVLASSISGPASRLQIAGTGANALGMDGADSDAALGLNTTFAVLQSVGGFVPGSAVRLETRGHIVAEDPMLSAMTEGAGINITVDGGDTIPIVFTGSDFAGGIGATTPAEVVTAINRQAQGFHATLNAESHLVLLSHTYGPNSSLASAPGTPNATAELGLTTSTPQVGVRLYRELNTVSEPSKSISWSTGLPAGGAPAFVQSVEFDLIVQQNGAEVERFESISMQAGLDDYVETVLNDQAGGSRYIMATNQQSSSGAGLNAPATGAFALSGGSDGGDLADTAYIGNAAARTGLYAFDRADIQLLACPETTSPGVVAASLAYCENRGDAMFVGATPPGLGLDGIKNYAGAFRGRKTYGALYAPWIQVANLLDTTGNNPRLWIPPTGHILGTYARITDARGVWKAPAGDEAQLRNALAVEFGMTDIDHTDLVKNGGVNGIRAIPGAGIIVDASRTLSTDSRWLFVNVRRLFNFIKSSLRDGLQFVPQEPHDEALRRQVRFNVITPFLLGLWRQGAFGSDAPEDVFTVKCDAENNPPAQVNLGHFTVEVYFYPVRPAETIIIIVGQQESGAAASEA